MNTRDGQNVLDFAHRFVRLTKGSSAGKLIELRPWQQELIRALVAMPYRRGLIGLPRKNGKSLLGAILALYGLVADGEEGAEVVSAAADREQARIVFGEARRIVELDPALSKHLKPYRNEIVHPASGSRYRVLSSEAYTKEGMNVSMAIIDELHAHPTRELYDVLSLATGARENPLILAITTAGQRYDRDGRDTLAYQQYQYGRRLDSGEAADPDFFFRWWEPADPQADHLSAKTWAEANPALGDYLAQADFEAAARLTPENEFRTKRCNQWVAAQQAWLPAGAWDALGAPQDRVPAGTRIVLGFDGSFSGDATALVGATVTEEPFVFLVGAWEKPALAPASWRVDHAEVEGTVTWACQKWNVVEVNCDPHLWRRDMEAWAEKRVPVVEFPNTPSRMVPATQRFYEAVTNKNLSHDGDPILARHVGNAVVKPSPQGPKLSKEHKDSGRKIDAAVAAVMAFERAAVLGNTPPIQFEIW